MNPFVLGSLPLLAGPIAAAASVATLPAVSRTTWSVDDVLTQGSPSITGYDSFDSGLFEDDEIATESRRNSIRGGQEDAGSQEVQMSVQLTADGKAILHHEDYLEDGTCIRTLTYEQIERIHPRVSLLSESLKVAQKKARTRSGETTRRSVVIEVKAPTPLCDPLDEFPEVSLAAAVISDVHRTQTKDIVIVSSISPPILSIVARVDPGIPLQLSSNALQFLAVDKVESIAGLPVKFIDKEVAWLKLDWIEIGPFFRCPSYLDVEDYVDTAKLIGAQFVDVVSLQQMNLDELGVNATG